MRANPMGVTTLAQVNGRGASARAHAKGNKAERLARARRLMKNAKGVKGAKGFGTRHRAAFMSANLKTTRGKRLGAYKKALGKGMSKNSARRSALRKVPFTASERSHGASFAGSRARYRNNKSRKSKGKGSNVRRNKKRKSSAKRRAPVVKRKSSAKRPRARRTESQEIARIKRKKAKNRTTEEKKLLKKYFGPGSKGYGVARKAGITYRTVTKTRKTHRKIPIAYGRYKRARLYNPRTGRSEYSYMYRTKSGRMRRIPTKAIMHGGDPTWAEIQKMREKRSAEILKHGGTFTPNKSRKRSKAAKKAAATRKRIAKYRAEGMTLAQARAAAHGGRKVKRRRRKTSKRRAKRASPRRTKRRTTKRRAARRATPKRRTKRRTTKRRASARRRTGHRKSPKRVAAGRKAARTRKRRAAARRRGRGGRRMRANRRRHRRNGRRSYASNRRRHRRRSYASNRRRHRRNGRRRMRRNAFMATLGGILKTGALAAVGFISHRVLTSLTCDYLFVKVLGATPNPTLVAWQKPICGTAVGLVGVGFLSVAQKQNWMSADTTLAIGGGMVASLLQSVVVSALMAANQPAVAGRLEGYSNSVAYSLHGRRRGLRGMQSIMPRYTPLGAYEQAAAGLGRRQMRGAGEYFTGMAAFEQAAAGIGEYFVPAGTKGVGQYEPAGPLATQAAASAVGPIDDGIRPDSNLDHVMDLAEAAAGVGEYITATPNTSGGYDEGTVPQSSQWIPNGPLWAGTLGAKANTETSEIPAGTLASPGGNGILSAP